MDKQLKNAFDALQTPERLKRATKAHVRKKTFDFGRDLTRLRTYRRRLAGVLAAVILCVAGIGVWHLPVTGIGLEVNPALELQVNLLDRVTALKGRNPDGEILAGQLKVKGLPYDEAMQRILICDQLKPYLEAGRPIAITVVGGSDTRARQMLSRVVCRAYAIVEEDNVVYFQTDRATVEAAGKAGLTVPQYQAWQTLLSRDPNATPEDIRQLELKEIEELIGFEKLESPCEN